MEATYEYDVECDAVKWCDEAPFPYMRFAQKSNGKPVMWLVDSQTISSGVWVQEDFDCAGNYIFLKWERENKP